MFGYIDVDKDIDKGQKGLWQTFMCGLCISSKNLVDNRSRIVIGNDINFFNVLFHSYMGIDVNIEHKRCVSSVIKKRTILSKTPITDKLALANMMLIYLNLVDDMVDKQLSVKKRIALSLYKGSYGKAVSQWQQFNDTMLSNYQLLRSLEKENCDSIDKVCHPFAKMSYDFAQLTLDNASTDILNLCYNMGKWVYLIDALDDIKQDFSKGNYNVFVSHYKADDISFVKDNIDEISFVMYTTLNALTTQYNDLNLSKYRCVLDSIIYKHLRTKTAEILGKYGDISPKE